MLDAGRAHIHDGGGGAVQVVDAAGEHRARRAGAGGPGEGRQAQGLAERIQMVLRQAPAESADPVADPGGQLPGTGHRIGAVEMEILHRAQCVGIELEMIRHAGGDGDGRADGIAGIAGREGAIEHIDAADILRRGDAEMRAGGAVVVADGGGHHHAIDKDQVAGAGAKARGAGGDRVLGIAIMAFAHDQRRREFQHVFGIDGVDLFLRLGGGDLGVWSGRIAAGPAVGGDDDIFGLQIAADGLGLNGCGGGAKRQKRCADAQGIGHGIPLKTMSGRAGAA